MRRMLKGACIMLILCLIIIRCIVFVDETEFVIVTLFGKITDIKTEPGLAVKSPLHSTIRLDKRIQLFDPNPSEFLLGDKKNIIVDCYMVWRVLAPDDFYQQARNNTRAERALQDIITSQLAAELGNYNLSDLLTAQGDRTTPPPRAVKTREIFRSVLRVTQRRAREFLGVEVLDVQLKRLNFPEQNKESVFRRMREERNRIAKHYLADGERQAAEIRADTDKSTSEILAQARRKAEEAIGLGEAEASRIYADAYSRDPEFFKLIRTLQAYPKVLDANTTIVLPGDSPLLELLEKGVPPAP